MKLLQKMKVKKTPLTNEKYFPSIQAGCNLSTVIPPQAFGDLSVPLIASKSYHPCRFWTSQHLPQNICSSCNILTPALILNPVTPFLLFPPLRCIKQNRACSFGSCQYRFSFLVPSRRRTNGNRWSSTREVNFKRIKHTYSFPLFL